MRKIIMALAISTALLMSGISVTSFSIGQFASSAWAEDGD
jgi:hypothetical protein